MVEQNNELLMKNHESRTTCFAPFPEMNATSFNGRGRGRVRGYGIGYYNRNHSYNKNIGNHQKWVNNEQIQGKDKGEQSKKNMENVCYRCGMKGHWSRTCRMHKHLVDLYQTSLNDKGKNVEINFV